MTFSAPLHRSKQRSARANMALAQRLGGRVGGDWASQSIIRPLVLTTGLIAASTDSRNLYKSNRYEQNLNVRANCQGGSTGGSDPGFGREISSLPNPRRRLPPRGRSRPWIPICVRKRPTRRNTHELHPKANQSDQRARRSQA